MKKMILADFDDTLIFEDSLVYIAKCEKWFLSPDMLFIGAVIVFNKIIHGDSLKYRSRLKYKILKKYKRMPKEKIMEYSSYFQTKINTKLIELISETEPDLFVVCSASDSSLIYEVLKDDLSPDIIIANEYTEDIPINEFVTCYGEEKRRRFVCQIPDYSNYDITVITDSISDLPIMRLGRQCLLVKNGKIENYNCN